MAPPSKKPFTRLVWEKDEITPNLLTLGPKLGVAIRGVMEYHAPRVQNHARVNAPWTDRTTNARSGLMAVPFGGSGGRERDSAGRFVAGGGARTQGIVLFHSVPYGIWLEVAHSGQYAIILPTIQDQGPKVMRTLQNLMGRL